MTSEKNAQATTPEPVVIAASSVGIAVKQVSRAAVQVVRQLGEHNYSGELVGGCVRDLLLGFEPKDYDVTTDARPEAVRQIFRRARLVGRRFRLAHVRIGREVIEVATYRTIPLADDTDEAPLDDDVDQSDASDDSLPDDEMNGNLVEEYEDDFDDDNQATVAIVDDNVYGTRAEDAMRRDFTVNALYYDPDQDAIVDYVDGMADLEARILRVIGDPETRFREDPVRMLRAARFCAKLDFELDADCEAVIRPLAHLIEQVPAARLFDELFKLFHHGKAAVTFDKLLELNLFESLMPKTQAFIDEPDSLTERLLRTAMDNTDQRVQQGKPVIAAFFFAVALWDAYRLRLDELQSYGVERRVALYDAADDVLEAQSRRVTIPRRVAIPIREIWQFQFRLEDERDSRPWRLVEHKRFRAAYDFYLLRAQNDDAQTEVGEWWTRYQELDKAGRDKMVNELRGKGGQKASKKKRKRRRKRRRSNGEADGNTVKSGPNPGNEA